MSKAERDALRRVVESSKRIVRRVPLRPDPFDELAAAQADAEDRAHGNEPR